MAIAINGSGTITGLAVGGLPDGTIDNGCMADDAIDSAELADGGIDSAHLASGVGGKILQVQNTTVTAIQTIAASSAWVDSLLTCAITPSSASNKILISMTATGEGNAANQQRFTYRIKKAISGGATSYLVGAAAGTRILMTGITGDLTDDSSTTASSFSLSNFLDSPSTTSAVTYTIQITYDSALGAGTYYLNRNATDTESTSTPRYISWITLMEVAG